MSSDHEKILVSFQNMENKLTKPFRATWPKWTKLPSPSSEAKRLKGPLHDFNQKREKILKEVVQIRLQQVLAQYQGASLEVHLGEALYLEKFRLQKIKKNFFTRKKHRRDVALWNVVQSELLKSPADSNREKILEKILMHYAQEIGGHFSPSVYRLATVAVPWGFHWLLNAASVRQFLPWKMTQSLSSKIRLGGEIESLTQLAQKGTILLVPTHQSNIDSILIGYVIYALSLPPFAYGAGLNLFSNPLISFFMSRLGAYTVDRVKNHSLYKETLKCYSTVILKNGIHSIFFPGGSRTRSGAIERSLKLGLLGTALHAQIENLKEKKEKPQVFIVPMVLSYHYVLEAGKMIERYLTDLGKHRYLLSDEDLWNPFKIIQFFWKFFSSQTTLTLRIGQPLDVFGNQVDSSGVSTSENGQVIQTEKWLISHGLLCHNSQRDQEYTRELGARLSERFHRENTILTSHLVAFSFFEALRSKFKDLDLFRLLRLSSAQRRLGYAQFLEIAQRDYDKIKKYADQGSFFLSPELNSYPLEHWIKDGVNQLGLLHESAVLKIQNQTIFTEDMNLLYYYRNRLTGYNLTPCEKISESSLRNNYQYDAQGFLV